MIKKIFINFKNWCNSNQGLLAFIALVIMLFNIVPFNIIDLSFTNGLFNKFWIILIYNIKIPVYILLIIILLSILYINKLKKRYNKNKIAVDFMIGNWINEWNDNGNIGTEHLEIRDKGKYYLNGEHAFNIEDFQYDIQKNQIRFFKTALRQDDNRRLLNVLNVINNDHLQGDEDYYKIDYKRK